MNFEVYNIEDSRVLELLDVTTQEIIDQLQDYIRSLRDNSEYYFSAYISYLDAVNQEEADFWDNEMTFYYDEMLVWAEEIVGLLETSVTCPTDPWVWYAGDASLPIVWINSEDEIRCVDVIGTTQQELELWDWHTSNGIADKDTTELAYEAITGNGFVSNFHHTVWNDLVDKTLAAIELYSSSWTTEDVDGNTYLSYEETKMSDENEESRTLTADRFNALRFNIGSRVSTGISPVSKGDVVLGEYFTKLTDALNTFINSYS